MARVCTAAVTAASLGVAIRRCRGLLVEVWDVVMPGYAQEVDEAPSLRHTGPAARARATGTVHEKTAPREARR